MGFASIVFCRKYYIQLGPPCDTDGILVVHKKAKPQSSTNGGAGASGSHCSPMCLVSMLVLRMCSQITTCISERLRLQLASAYRDMSLFQ